MNASRGRTGVVLSFHGRWAGRALRLAEELEKAHLEVVLDVWDGGGGLPAVQRVERTVGGARFLLPVMTPGEGPRIWIGPEWERAMLDEARRRSVTILPVRGAICDDVPAYLDAGFADLANRPWRVEVRRLVERIAEVSGDPRIRVPPGPSDQEVGPPSARAATEPIIVELGSGLLPLFRGGEGAPPEADPRFPLVRDGLFHELGVAFPDRVTVRPGSDLPPLGVRFLVHGVPELEDRMPADRVLVNAGAAELEGAGYAATAAVNPANLKPAAWVTPADGEALVERGLAMWDRVEWVDLLLSTVLRRRAAAFVGVTETTEMLSRIRPVFPHLVEVTVPGSVSPVTLTEVLRRLVDEGVSVRNLRRVLLAVAGRADLERDPGALTEVVRHALQRQIVHQMRGGDDQLAIFLLDPALEERVRSAFRPGPTGPWLDLEPDAVRAVVAGITQGLGRLDRSARTPPILTRSDIRAAVRRMIAPSLPLLPVISYHELPVDTTLQPVGRIGLDGLDRPPRGTVVGPFG